MSRLLEQLRTDLGTSHLATGYRNQWKTRTQNDAGPLQEAAIGQLAHHAFLAQHENHVSSGTKQGIHRQHKRQRHNMAATSGKQEDTQ
jgi:hypothetical protein